MPVVSDCRTEHRVARYREKPQQSDRNKAAGGHVQHVRSKAHSPPGEAQSIGQSVSIIGGLVVGSAAVEARLISPAALIVVAVAGICGFAVPGQDLSGAVRAWRFFLTLAAALAGLFGLTLAGICLAVHLGALTSLGVPYLSPFSDVSAGEVLLRRRMAKQTCRPWVFRPRDLRNQR